MKLNYRLKQTNCLKASVLIAISLLLFSLDVTAEVQLQKTHRFININELPPLEYSKSTRSYINEFLTFYNNGDYNLLYNMFSQRLAGISNYSETKDLIIFLNVLFGRINELEEIKQLPTTSNEVEAQSNLTGYLLSTLKDWKFCLDNSFIVRIYVARCDKRDGYLFIGLSGNEGNYKIELFDLSYMDVKLK